MNSENNGQMKVKNTEDSTVNFIKTTIYDEDHTLGNMVRTQLLRDKTVKFAGYRRPHPLMKEIEMKVQTTSEKNPSKAVEESCGLLIDHIDQIESKFREAMQSFKGKSFPYAM